MTPQTEAALGMLMKAEAVAIGKSARLPPRVGDRSKRTPEGRPANMAPGSVQARIWDLLAARGPLTLDAIRRAMPDIDANIREAMANLSRRGAIRRLRSDGGIPDRFEAVKA